ncbi:MAG TPA: hypothetical protein VIL49_18560 [Capillimicrobium sp.]
MAEAARDYPFGRAAGTFFLGGAGPGALPPGRPLLAYGANGSPERLARKLPGAPVAALAATLRGFAVVHSRHVSPYGQVPATLVEQPGAVAAVHVLLVADRAPLDATEPNYDLATLRGVALEADLLGPLDEVDAYRSKHGPLLLDGRPVPLGSRPQADLRAALSA